MRNIKTFGLLMLVLVLAACDHSIAKYKTTALKRLHEAEIGLNTGFDLVEDFRTNNLITKEKEIESLRLIGTLNGKVRKVNSVVRGIDPATVSAGDSSSVESAVKELKDIVSSLQQSGLLGIKSPTSVLTFDAVLATMNLAIADGNALVDAIKAVKK